MKPSETFFLKALSPKNFLFISREAVILDLAWCIKNEGHKVKFYIDVKSEREVGAGFVQRVKHWEKHIDWADIIIFDHVGYGEIAENLRKQGKLVVGGSQYTDQLENDRSFGQDELEAHGIKILDYEEFSDFDTAIAFVKTNPGKYVIKPSGEAQHQKQFVFIGAEEDGSDVIRILKSYQKTWGDEISTFQLQKKMTGVEVSVAAFFNGKKFIAPINITFEHKKLFPGELGVSTGEMGTSMFWNKSSPIFEKTLRKMEPRLAKTGYVGSIDLNTIVNNNGIYPLEFTCRFGHPQISIQREGILDEMGALFYQLAQGKDFTFKTRKGFQVGVLLVVPPFPYKDNKTLNSFSKDAVVVFEKKNYEGIHPQDLRSYKGEWLITGSSGIALLVTGTGTTMREAQKQAYGRIQHILIPNMYYRTDIGNRWYDEGDKLHSWGYI
ncbi:MAG: phosphoribosylglycinamide synthetase C domain-containing protein [bacterium]|nr:phosphoribosylglycinamide synthetase C domain-containing protein [bacterium]